MSEISKASHDAIDAARNSQQLELITAVLAAQQIANQQAPAPVCQHAHPVVQSSGGAAKWIGLGVGGSILLLTVAISAVAVAISAVSVAILVLVLKSVWNDVKKR